MYLANVERDNKLAFKSHVKSYTKLLVKVLCLSVLFYGGIEVTKEYFSYPYVYRLSVKPSEGLHLPPIISVRKGMCFLIRPDY